ncbi:MAG TPA: hypothetical protein DEB31_02300 [Clostridiales bacterium]|nr:hypothetical protein [Clostridiales bacterium]
MSITVEKEHVDRYMRIMELEPTGRYLYAQVLPAAQQMLFAQVGLTPLAMKNIVLAFTKEVILLIALDPVGHFIAKHIRIDRKDLAGIEFKKKWMQSKLVIKTAEYKDIRLNIPNSVANMPWQKPNLQQLIDDNWNA